MIKIYKVDSMRYTPFSNSEAVSFLETQGIHFVNNEHDCDILVGRRFAPLASTQLSTTKKALLWTHEPRFDTHFEKQVYLSSELPPLEIMNTYTGDIYQNNYTCHGRTFSQKLGSFNKKDFFTKKSKKIAILAICRNRKNKWSLKRNGVELDLCYLRTRIALEGRKLGVVDVYGKGWPRGVSIENSRNIKSWNKRKKDILEPYNFNLCFENTNFDYYCTEKIWDSIQSGCLPIYYGNNNKIYETFPENSFLDYCKFESARDLFQYVQNMEAEEFCERMNLCIQAGNKILEKRNKMRLYGKNIDEKMLSNIIERLHRMLSS